MSPVRQLKDEIESAHGCSAKHIESVPVVVWMDGPTLWEGVVEVFDLRGHARAKRCYAWYAESHHGERSPTIVLGIGPVRSPFSAVRIAILRELAASASEPGTPARVSQTLKVASVR